jgi:hypothetical protein
MELQKHPMKTNRILSIVCALVLTVSLFVPQLAHASGRGLFKDMYCAMLSLVNKECELEIDGIRIKVRAEGDRGLISSAQDAAGDLFSRVFSR